MQQFSALSAASGVESVPSPVPILADIDAAFERLIASGVEAFVNDSNLGTEGDTRVAGLALSHHLVSLGPVPSYPSARGLASYGPDYNALYRRASYYIDRILKGAKPADLPVELPTTFDLIVNQATGRALGVTIPDEVAQQVTSWGC